MQPFTMLTGVAAPLPMINFDTERIIPKQYLKTITRSGLGVHLFDDLRYTPEGKEVPDFVLNKPAYRDAKILITGENFGCGSSREHAPWALLDFGIRSIIAPSFADIFYTNCLKNGMLPVVLSGSEVDSLLKDAEAGSGLVLTVDLEAQTVTRPDGAVLRFDIEPFRKHCLLNGLDDIGLTLGREEAIARFEARQRAAQPWLYGANRGG